MTAANIISEIGTLVSVLGIITSNVPDAPDKAKVQYIIANDDPDGTGLTNAGCDLPDVRMWDETAEFLGANYDDGYVAEGSTTCTTEVNTQEAATYALFSGNDDAICIAWTGMAWAGGQKKYGFHPGNWAHGCDAGGYRGDKQSGTWYYAAQKVPGIKNEDEVFCAWVDKNGDVETTGFQPLSFCTEYDPIGIIHYTRKRNMFADHPSVAMSPVPDGHVKSATERQADRLAKRFAQKKRIIKGYFQQHKASELCDRNLHVAGPSFVSYQEKQFCYMPNKPLYPFCQNSQDGLCWDDEANAVIAKGDTGRAAIPDLSNIQKTVVWGKN